MRLSRGGTRTITRRVVLAVAVYLVGWFATALVFLLTNGSGIEATPNEALPYYAMFGVLYGATLAWWWLLPFPFLHFFVFEPILNEIRYEGPVHYANDRPGYLVAGTLGIAAGIALRKLYQRTSFGRAYSERA